MDKCSLPTDLHVTHFTSLLKTTSLLAQTYAGCFDFAVTNSMAASPFTFFLLAIFSVVFIGLPRVARFEVFEFLLSPRVRGHLIMPYELKRRCSVFLQK